MTTKTMARINRFLGMGEPTKPSVTHVSVPVDLMKELIMCASVANDHTCLLRQWSVDERMPVNAMRAAQNILNRALY